MSDWHHHYDRARAAIELKRWDIAHEQVLLALADAPNDSMLHVTRAEVCYRQANFEQARLSAEEAIARDPNFALGYFWLAWCLITDANAGAYRISEATQLADRALECSPHDADIYHLRATAAQVSGQAYEAQSFAQSGLQINPEHLGCLETLARIQGGTHPDPKAEATLRQMLQLEPESAFAHEEMSRVALHCARFAEAYEHASIAIRQAPNSYELRELHAEVVRHQHPLARFLLWSAKSWENHLRLILYLCLIPLLSLLFIPASVSRELEAIIAAVAVLFVVAFACYGPLAGLAAETIIAHSARLSLLVPEIRSRRTYYAFLWACVVTVAIAIVAAVAQLSAH